jgi:membrane associated rhomboid family serine protease
MATSVWLRVKIIAGLILFITLVHVINDVLDGQLNQWGVVPRSLGHGLYSVFHLFTAPFIHGSYQHLFNNIIGLTVFSAFCLLRSVRFYVLGSLFIIMMSGVLVWLFGRSASHIGASGWVLGLWSLSIAMAFAERNVKNILIALVVIFLYGGMIYNVLPTASHISFEAHLFGAIAGVLFAFIYQKYLKRAGSNELV